MCLEVTLKVSPLANAGIGAERIAAATGLTVLKGHNNLGTCLHLCATGPCSCDFLEKGAKQVAEGWLLNSSARQSLAAAVALVGKEAKSFSFQARWLDDDINEPRRIKLAALLEAICSNSIPKNTTLLVGSHP